MIAENKLYQSVIEEAQHIFHPNGGGLTEYGMGRAQQIVDQLLVIIDALRNSLKDNIESPNSAESKPVEGAQPSTGTQQLKDSISYMKQCRDDWKKAKCFPDGSFVKMMVSMDAVIAKLESI